MTNSLSAITTKCLLFSHSVAWALALLAGFCVAYFNTLGKIDTHLRNSATHQAGQVAQYISFISAANPEKALVKELTHTLHSNRLSPSPLTEPSSIRVYNSVADLFIKKPKSTDSPEYYRQKLEAGSSPNGFYRHNQSIATDHHGVWNIEVILDKAQMEKKLNQELVKQFITVLICCTLIFSLIFLLMKRSLVKAIVETEIAKHTLDNMQEGVVVIDNNDKILNYNQMFIKLTGISEELLTKEGFKVHQLVDDSSKMRSLVREQLRINQRWCGELQIKRGSDEPIPAKVSISIVRNNVNRVAAFVIVINNLTEQKTREKQLEQLAYFDPLTTLANRASFDLRLKHEVDVCRRLDRKLCILFIDLDKFKTVNDTLGHECGDQVLKIIAKRFRTRLRNTDTLARIGGDEFTVILPDLDGNGGFEKLGRELITLAGSAIRLDQRDVFLGASIGAAIFPDDATHVINLLKLADAAMYRAKSQGRNQIVFHHSEHCIDCSEQKSVAHELQQAIYKNELQLVYQAKINMRTGNIEGYEALLRWKRDNNLVAPAKFLRIAEERGLINQVDRWVIRAGIQQLKSWHTRFRDDISLAINISSIQFYDAELIPFLGSEVHRAKLDPAKIEIEIKESTLCQDEQRAAKTIRSLKRLGVKVVIDDFGTGYSSIGCLGKLPIDCLKIDQSFVSNIKEEQNDQTVAKTVISLAKSLGIDVVAEGVERKLQETVIKDLGCQLAQGYLFSRPLPAKQIERELESVYEVHA